MKLISCERGSWSISKLRLILNHLQSFSVNYLLIFLGRDISFESWSPESSSIGRSSSLSTSTPPSSLESCFIEFSWSVKIIEIAKWKQEVLGKNESEKFSLFQRVSLFLLKAKYRFKSFHKFWLWLKITS